MGRHLVLGQLVDYVTGRTATDTHDERLRQRIAHLLIDELDYRRTELRRGETLTVQTERHQATWTIDLRVVLGGRSAMLICYAPGAIVARERQTVALARLAEETIIPWAAITNGRDARILDAASGRVHATGLEGLPRREVLLRSVAEATPQTLRVAQRAAESRILVAFDGLKCACADDD